MVSLLAPSERLQVNCFMLHPGDAWFKNLPHYLLSSLNFSMSLKSLSRQQFFLNFFKEIYCTEKSVKYTRLQNFSLNEFAIVVLTE